ncbi:MAG: type II toxin-antitoxin system prevent-host-death family antitoxin [Planctomycetota bacterium]
MAKYNIHQAKTHLSRLIRAALAGEEIVIAKGNRPLVKLVPLPEARPTRRLDGAADVIRVSNDFDAPLEDFQEYMG